MRKNEKVKAVEKSFYFLFFLRICCDSFVDDSLFKLFWADSLSCLSRLALKSTFTVNVACCTHSSQGRCGTGCGFKTNRSPKKKGWKLSWSKRDFVLHKGALSRRAKSMTIGRDLKMCAWIESCT